jgi:hypothetical protein
LTSPHRQADFVPEGNGEIALRNFLDDQGWRSVHYDLGSGYGNLVTFQDLETLRKQVEGRADVYIEGLTLIAHLKV